MPPEEKVSTPGFALAASTISFTVLYDDAGLTTKTPKPHNNENINKFEHTDIDKYIIIRIMIKCALNKCKIMSNI